METLKPDPTLGKLAQCKNIRRAGYLTIPDGPLAGTILPLFEMTSDPTPKTVTTAPPDQEKDRRK